MFVGFYHHSTVSHRKRISHLVVGKVQVFKLRVHVGLVSRGDTAQCVAAGRGASPYKRLWWRGLFWMIGAAPRGHD